MSKLRKIPNSKSYIRSTKGKKAPKYKKYSHYHSYTEKSGKKRTYHYYNKK